MAYKTRFVDIQTHHAGFLRKWVTPSWTGQGTGITPSTDVQMKRDFVSRAICIPQLNSTTVYGPELAHLLSRVFPPIVLTTKRTVEKSGTLIDVAQLNEWAEDRKCEILTFGNGL